MISDEALAMQVMNGSFTAFEDLVNRYKNSIFAIVYRIVGQYQESEDITQDVFVTVYEKLYQFDNNKKFKPWIQRIAINASITVLRKRKKIVNFSFDENINRDIEYQLTVNIPDPQTAIEKKELREEINKALAEINDGYRLLLILRYQMDLDNKEIAEILKVSRENIEVRLHRARKSLRRVLVKKWSGKELSNELPSVQ